MKAKNMGRITEDEKAALRLAQAEREIETWEETARGHVKERSDDAEINRRALMRTLTMVGAVTVFVVAVGLMGWVVWVIQNPP